ncbi:MAG: glycoside hydrolase family 57 protein [Lawsonella sp.]
MSSVPGMFSLVLHTHLPWFAHHGEWPVGEELLYQAWGASYIPVVEQLFRLADEGYRDIMSLGVTPTVAAQLDDSHCLQGMTAWLANWQMRAHEAKTYPGTESATGDSTNNTPNDSPQLSTADIHAMGQRELSIAEWTSERYQERWQSGGSPVLRELGETGVVELLGGPLAHPFQPLLTPPMRTFLLRAGLSDSMLRRHDRPHGLWAPECAYTPGMEKDYEAAGISHFMVDGPSFRGDTAVGRPVRDSNVVAFARDLTVSYRVWSPKAGYPGHGDYRDFHTFHHPTGFKPARVTGRNIGPHKKQPYDPQRAIQRLDHDVADFVDTVINRLQEETARTGRPAHVVAAFDTELFGHWWYEGPLWLGKVLRALDQAGVELGSLDKARRSGYVGAPIELRDCSWGSGKDWRVWEGPAVSDIVDLNQKLQSELREFITAVIPARSAQAIRPRNAIADQVLQEAVLALQSDWAFLISKDTAADYARDRAFLHAHAMREIIATYLAGDTAEAEKLCAAWRAADSPFPQLDARLLRDVYDECVS